MKPSVVDWVENVALPGRRIVESRRLTGGYSNENTALTTDDGGRYVLRRYLRHNKCALESALAARLKGTVPVAEVVAADPTGASAGEPLLLSTFVEGRPLNEVVGDDVDLGREVGAALAAIGTIEFEAPGFFKDGLQPDGLEPTVGLDQFVDRCLREGNAAGHLTEKEQEALRRYAVAAATDLAAVKGSRRLVHSDFNPKNLLVARSSTGRWRVAAVLDWEFAFSSTPLVDIGNMLRDPRPPVFLDGFLGGFRDAGGELPPNWRRISQAADLFALADFLTRPVEHRYFRRSIDRIRELVKA
ncbi:phosphotransferase family protein [Paractinoplanes lichenicola]|uniref:Phosphotransferase n=1 Tax=Paractinoplanes lichenicola TaxID=2802976 RepID=A0ABS1VT71_9ACTN|nr:phosphotransferase [Actinoplanes lichenicola]MBL7257663.1 phosphotransferase [Actinoplanes lichenicola]